MDELKRDGGPKALNGLPLVVCKISLTHLTHTLLDVFRKRQTSFECIRNGRRLEVYQRMVYITTRDISDDIGFTSIVRNHRMWTCRKK